MAEPVRARRLTDEDGRRLQQIVRRDKHGTIRLRHADADADADAGDRTPGRRARGHRPGRDHAFNEIGLRALDP